MRKENKKGYEKADYEERYRKNRKVRPKEKELFQQFFDLIQNHGKVLDLGCGTGLPFDKYILENNFDVLGVDIAEKHVEKAKENVPEAEIVQGDFFDLELEKKTISGLVSFYAIFHVPRKEHEKLFSQIYDWLEPGGAILVTMGNEETDNHRAEWSGNELVWSSYSAEKNKKLIENAGFESVDFYVEDWRDESHIWILAKKK